MRVLLISANTEKINILPMPLGLNYVAAATQNKGHEVKVLDLMAHADSRLPIEETIESFRPDIIGISVRNIDDQNMSGPKFLLDGVKGIVLFAAVFRMLQLFWAAPATAFFLMPFLPIWKRTWAFRVKASLFFRNCWRGWKSALLLRDYLAYM